MSDDAWIKAWHDSDVAVENKDCIKDMRQRDVWPFNQSETVTEMPEARWESGFAPTEWDHD